MNIAYCAYVHMYILYVCMQNGDESDHEESIHEDCEVGSYRCLS